MQKFKFSRMALALILAMALVMAFMASCDTADPVDTGAETPETSDTPSNDTPTDDPEPATTPDPGMYLGGNTFDPAFNPGDPDCSAYEVVKPAESQSITVKFIMEAPNSEEYYRGEFRDEHDVTLSSGTAKNFTVTDLLVELDDGGNQLQASYDFYTTGDAEFTDTSTYLLGVLRTDEQGVQTLFQPGEYDLLGWVFRVNDKFPVQPLDGYNDYYEGTSVLQTYLKDGDAVHFFWDYPATESGYNYAAKYIRIIPETVTNSTITAQLQGFVAPMETVQNELQMQVDNYEEESIISTSVHLYDANGEEVTSVYTDASGIATFSGPFVSGNYTLVADKVLLTNDPNDNYNGYLFSQTSGYVEIAVPSSTPD